MIEYIIRPRETGKRDEKEVMTVEGESWLVRGRSGVQ